MSESLVTSFAEALDVFESAWRDPGCTRVELPAVDVNDVLAHRYDVSPSHVVTRAELWDMERAKAWDPTTYIPYVVSQGRSWGKETLPDASTRHLRSSVQRAWLTDTSGLVLEEVVSHPEEQRVLFLGRERLCGPDTETLAAEPFQPLFHVEHAVGGSEGAPTNLWRIVLLAEESTFHEPFDAMVRAGWLPGFLEIYLQRDLGLTLQRR